MPDIQGIVTYEGIDPQAIIGGEMTLGQGTSPSAATIRMVSQTKPLKAKTGLLRFTYGGTRIDFPDALIDTGTIAINSGGHIWSIHILDRRWKWAFGEINGRYNFRAIDGGVEARSEKTARELAKLLLKAMGERDIGEDQVKALPEQPRPFVDWAGANPAAELSSLCDSTSCVVCLGLDNKVWIRRKNTGATLPDGGMAMNASLGLTSRPRPDKLIFQCGLSRYQVKFRLRAVGPQVGGDIVPIDELGYTPEQPVGSKWTQQGYHGGFPNVDKIYVKKLANKGVPVALLSQRDDTTFNPANPDVLVGIYAHTRDLAKGKIFQWYQIHGLAEGPKDGPPLWQPAWWTGGKLTDIRSWLPLEDALVEMTFNAAAEGAAGAGLVKGALPPYCEGTFTLMPSGKRTLPFTLYPRDFSLDADKGIVQFSDMVFKMSDKPPWVEELADALNRQDDAGALLNKYMHPAEMYLVCAASPRDSEGYQQRFTVTREMPDPKLGGGVLIVPHDEVVYTRTILYEGAGIVGGGVGTNNQAEVEAEAKHYLDAVEKEYILENSQDIEYAGLLPFEPDGAVRQVSWKCGSNTPATTRVSRGIDHAHFVPTYDMDRRKERERQLVIDRTRLKNLQATADAGIAVFARPKPPK